MILLDKPLNIRLSNPLLLKKHREENIKWFLERDNKPYQFLNDFFLKQRIHLKKLTWIFQDATISILAMRS